MLRTCALVAAATTCLFSADLPREKQLVDGRSLPVSAKSEITIGARSDQDVRNRELWYRRFENGQWKAWQKHGLTFGRETPITWAPPEAHWQIYLLIEEVSGLRNEEPGPNARPSNEFIIDRTPPAVSVNFPPDAAELRGGATYEISWTANDPHLHSTPITIRWARSGDGEKQIIAENIANTGNFSWTTPLDMTANGSIEILAADKAGNVGSHSTSSIVIDAIAPSRNILGPQISANRQLDVAIRALDAGPAGLASVQLYYSSDNGSSWAPGPKIVENFDKIPWTTPTDGMFLLNLVATDEAGNANPIPSGKPANSATLLVDSSDPVVTLGAATGIQESNANPEAPIRRIFKPGDRVSIPFTIKDPNVRPDGVTVSFQAQAGGPWDVIGENQPPGVPFAFSIPNIASTTARVKVSAIDAAGNQGEVVAGETFAIDNKVETGVVEVDL